MTAERAPRLVRIRYARVAALMALATVVAAAPARAQGPASSQAWLAAVRAHTTGAVDDAVVTISRWSPAVAVATVRKAVRETTDPAVLQRALILHTDAAIYERAAFEAGGHVRPGGGALLLDARAIGTLPRSPHWQIGREIAAALNTRPGGRSLVQRWYRATGALLQQWADCGALRPHLEDGLRLLPDDPVLLLYSATLHQTYADPRVQRFVRPATANPISDLSTGGGVGLRRDAQGNLVSSSIGSTPTITGYDRQGHDRRIRQQRRRRALSRRARPPASHRAGRVVGRSAHPAGARARGEGPARGCAPPRRGRARLAAAAVPGRSLAAMVLGWSFDALQRPAEARRAFERAAAVFPLAQSARIALSRHALEGSHTAEGLAAIVETSGPKAARDAGNPWWSYFRVHDPDSKTLLAALRGQAR